MKKAVLSQCEQGSAEQVVAHAAWRRSRGRMPSMTFVGERNPGKALELAKAVVDVAKNSDLVNLIGAAIVHGNRLYDDMSDPEIGAAARYIITSSSSENEVRQRLRDEIGYPYEVDLHINIPDDATGREARELVRGLGGLVMKNGAMMMAMMRGHDGIINP